MSYPADAFTKAIISEAADGTLLYVQGVWLLRTRFEAQEGVRKQVLVLTGPTKGAIHAAPNDFALATAPGVSLELRVSDPTTIERDEDPAAPALVVAVDGRPELWGHLPTMPDIRYGYKADGSPAERPGYGEGGPVFQFSEFEVWLVRDGKPLSDGPLFTIG